jgi:hypothetical protein
VGKIEDNMKLKLWKQSLRGQRKFGSADDDKDKLMNIHYAPDTDAGKNRGRCNCYYCHFPIASLS